MDTALKIVQIAFYVTASIIAILTFLKAKDGLLNSVNTEYQKRVMDRLARLSDEIYAEFDPDSSNYWVIDDPAKEVMNRLHEEVKPHKDEILRTGKISPGIPMPKRLDELTSFLDRIRSDPFVPNAIREQVVGLLKKRTDTMRQAFIEELNSYKEGLKNGEYWDTMDENHNWVHNKILQRLYDNGCGISQVEQAAHEVRMAIQKYMEKFNPLKTKR